MARKQFIREAFFNAFNCVADDVVHAPGRVNLIGEHTDYNDGFVLPVAINFGTDVAIKARLDKQVNVVAVDFSYQLNCFDLTDIHFSEQAPWTNYIRGVLAQLLTVFPAINGADIVVSGDVPQGTGLSSSASFEIAILQAFIRLYGLSVTGVEAALMGQRAENDFVGCRCGIMDQLICAMGKADHAMLLDCRKLTFEHARIPKTLSVMIINSNVKRGLVDSEYNLRREQCEMGAVYFKKAALRDVSLSELERAAESLDPVIYKRAKHVISENQRTLLAVDALQKGAIEVLSELMMQSHLSMQHDFEITTPEIDYLVTIIAEFVKEQGGVRMTGGGFGGCVVALVKTDLVTQVKQQINTFYEAKTGLKADIYVCTTAYGAFNHQHSHLV